MKGLRNYINSIKPNFVGEGKYSKWFPLFDAVENFVFSTQTKTSNPVHVRDGFDIQKIMVIVWLSTFPAMFFGMYNLGAHSLEYLESINQVPSYVNENINSESIILNPIYCTNPHCARTGTYLNLCIIHVHSTSIQCMHACAQRLACTHAPITGEAGDSGV